MRPEKCRTPPGKPRDGRFSSHRETLMPGDNSRVPIVLSGRATACVVAPRDRCRLRRCAFPLFTVLSEYLLLGLVGVLLFILFRAERRMAFGKRILSWAFFCFYVSSCDCTVLAVHAACRLSRMGSLASHRHRLGILTGSFAWPSTAVPQEYRTGLHRRPIVWGGDLELFAHLPEISFPWNLLGYPRPRMPGWFS